MKIEIAVLCLLYQKRLNWMLNSILQQTGDKPEITVSIAYTPNNGNPTTEELIHFFRQKGLNIIDVILNEKEAPNRSISRNQRVKNTQADWIVFADADMVYHPLFFADIAKKLQTDQFKNETRFIGANRHSLKIPFCVNYFKQDNLNYPCVIENVASLVSKWPISYIGGKGVAAGYFQLANVAAIKAKGNIYSKAKRDNLKRFRADRYFRLHMGGRVGMDTYPQYHLNHERDNNKEQK